MTDQNTESTQRLADLVEALRDEDLSLDLGHGWTIATALGHLAFWDRRQALNLAAWLRGTAPVDADDVNEALEPILTALNLRAAADLAIVAASELDRALVAIPEKVRSDILSSEHAYIVHRAPHRIEHTEQIEHALARD